MSSRQTFKSRNRLLIAVSIFILALLSWRFFPTPGTFLSDIVIRPILQGENFLYKVTNREVGELTTSEIAELQVLREENATLRSIAEGETEADIVAGIIGRPTALPYDVLLIDKGAEDNIVVGAPVFAGESVAIGFVTAVYNKSSLVALVSTPGYVSTVYVYGPNIYTTAVGIGGGVTRIHVPQGVELSVGDTVVMPSLAHGIYGSITVVDSVPERPEQYGYLTGETPISSLRFVFIGRRPLAEISFEEAREVVDQTRRDFLTVDVPADFLIEAETDISTTSDEVSTSTEEINPSDIEAEITEEE